MEEYLDKNIATLRDKLARYEKIGQPFDLKKVLHYYVIDVLGELAFSHSFGVQIGDDESKVPPVVEHSLLAAATGSWPAMTRYLKKWLPMIPYKPLQKLFAGRRAVVDLASQCVDERRRDLEDIGERKESLHAQKKDLLTSLMLAKHPDTGEHLSDADLKAEAFGFM